MVVFVFDHQLHARQRRALFAFADRSHGCAVAAPRTVGGVEAATPVVLRCKVAVTSGCSEQP